MAYKMKGSPLKQFGTPQSIINTLAMQQSQGVQNTSNGSLMGAMTAAATATGTPGMGTTTNTVAALAPPVAKEKVKYNMVKPNRAIATPPVTPVGPQAPGIKGPSTANMVQPNPTRSIPGRARITNPSSVVPTPINPKAMGNPGMVAGVYGTANPDSFTRTVNGSGAPIMQLANPELLQDGPELPPQGVETSVTPTLGFENS
jgi:hypothetical protein